MYLSNNMIMYVRIKQILHSQNGCVVSDTKCVKGELVLKND